MDEGVKVHGMAKSPYYWRVAWTLKLKGVPLEYIEENLSSKSELLLQYNPVYGKVPVLVHDGKPICESSAIIEYIDETWSNHGIPLMPARPYDRAVARFWTKFADVKSGAVWPVALNKEEEKEEAVKECWEVLRTIEEKAGLGGETKFLCGDEIGMVDVAFSSFTYWLGLIEQNIGVNILEPHKFPRLSSWAHNFREHPVIKANSPF